VGEKERGTLEEEERQTQQSSFGERAAQPRDKGSQREGGGVTHEDTWTGQRLAAEDAGGGGAPDAESAILKSRSNIRNNREAAPDDGDGTPDPAESINLNSSRSNVYRTSGHNDAGEEAGLAIGDQGAVEPEKKPRPK